MLFFSSYQLIVAHPLGNGGGNFLGLLGVGAEAVVDHERNVACFLARQVAREHRGQGAAHRFGNGARARLRLYTVQRDKRVQLHLESTLLSMARFNARALTHMYIYSA